MNRMWTVIVLVLLVVVVVLVMRFPKRASSAPPAIVAGAGHSCRITGPGAVECWGGNANGQLGNGKMGTTMPIAGPTLPLGATARAIAAGNLHTCVVLTGGAVTCWGDNSKGQLGNNSTMSSATPVTLTITNAADIAAGAWHTCAVLTTGAVQCWGFNHVGQLGNSTTTESHVPVPVSGVTDAKQVSTGFAHSCVLRNAGTVSCWGGGALGTGAAGSTTPVAVPGITGAEVVVAGFTNTCAVLASGGVSCWGANAHGELGDGSTTARAAPGAVSGITGATALAVGGSHACAVVASGELFCWGDNSLAQLGMRSATGAGCGPGPNPGFPCAVTPVKVAGITGAIDVTAGDSHTCVLFPGARAECFGWNGYGQLGNGESSVIGGIADTSLFSAFPVRVTRKTISVGGQPLGHSCALLPDGTARCWGTNLNGQLGNGAIGTGANPGSATPVQVTGLTTIVQLSAGGSHTCALLSDATLRCWGKNIFGQLGVPQGPDVASPVAGGPNQVVEVGTGRQQTCAIRSGSLNAGSSALFCWGVNNNGQLGAAPALPLCTGPSVAVALPCTHIPVAASAVFNAAAVGGGAEHACALAGDGRVWCWGQNIFGQLGANTAGAPLPVPGVTGVVGLAVGATHNCAVLTTGSVVCWGDNRWGQLSGAPGTVPVTVRVTVPGISNATMVIASGEFSCALLRDGTVRCWGRNSLGQLGNPGAGASSPTPVTVTGLADATYIATAAGGVHACAVVESGSVMCWGANGTGELGRGTKTTVEGTAANVISLQ